MVNRKSALGQYIYNLGLGVDQFANVVLLGDPDESLCGRTARAIASGRAKWFVHPIAKVIDFIYSFTENPGHLYNDAIESEERPWEKEIWSWIRK